MAALAKITAWVRVSEPLILQLIHVPILSHLKHLRKHAVALEMSAPLGGPLVSHVHLATKKLNFAKVLETHVILFPISAKMGTALPILDMM
jgi:hypothetical protein